MLYCRSMETNVIGDWLTLCLTFFNVRFSSEHLGALNLQDRKMTDNIQGVENAGLEIDGQ